MDSGMNKVGSWFDRMSMVGQANVAPPRQEQTKTEVKASAVDDTSEPVPVQAVVAALRQVFDPEIPVNIYDLGLIYRVDISERGDVEIDMTLTAPGCPVAQEIPGMVEGEVCRVPGVKSVHVEIVWDPPWTPERMSDEAKLELGML